MNAPKKSHVVFHLLGIAVVTAGLVASLSLASNRKRAEAREMDARVATLSEGPLVRVAAAKLAPPGRSVTLSGEVEPYRQATLYAKVSGYLKMISVDKGDHVAQDEVLGVIEAPEVEQEALSKEADLALKKLTDERYQALATNGIVSELAREKTAADVRIASADLSRLNALRGYEVIRAPFAGVITARHADPGALLQAATSSQSALALVDIADIERVRVVVYLAQSDALFAHEGDPVVLWAEQRLEKRIDAKITRFTKRLDPRTRTMLTEIEVPNKDGAFYPGTFVKVSLKLATPPALTVPAEALVFRDGASEVARVVDGRTSFVKVEIGDTDGQVVRVRSGIAEGDLIVIHPGDEVADGGAVRVAEK